MAAVRRLAAIMFTDMVGYTASAQTDEAGTLQRLREQETIVRPLLAAHQGREVKSTGDGFLVEFGSALRAVQCAVAIHERLRARNSQPGALPIRLRISVHVGDVEERAGDIFGDAVNVASRMLPEALPGGVCISGAVYDLVQNKVPVRFERLPPTMLKDVRFPIPLYRVESTAEGVSAPARSAPGSRLAVLPLVNISPDAKDEYIADGLTEELTATLSKIEGLRVIARTSVGQYKSSPKSVAQIATELDVASVLEGSVRKAGNHLRITLQLIDARTQEHLWADTYDRELDDVFAVQAEVAERTASVLELDLLASAKRMLARRPTSNVAAHTYYLRGVHAARQSTAEGHRTAIQFLEEAVTADPMFSLAHSYLANEYLFLSGETLAPNEVLPRVKELVALALALDPDSSDAHTARGNLAMQLDQDWTTAEAEFKHAVALNPSNAEAHFWYAILLMVLRRFGAARDQMQHAIELEPVWWLPKRWLAQIDLRAGDLPSALVLAETDRDANPNDPTVHINLALLYAAAGRRDDARREAEQSTRPVTPYGSLDWAFLWSWLGRPEEAKSLEAEWSSSSSGLYVPELLFGALYAMLGEVSRSMGCLEQAYDHLDRGLWLEYPEHFFDSVRREPRFRALLERLKVPVDS